MPDTEELIYLNGLNASTGRPLIEPIPYKQFMEQILTVYAPDRLRRDDQALYGHERFAPFDEYPLDDPMQAGWALLVHADEADRLQACLKPLIEHRKGRVLLYSGEPVREWKETHHADVINPARFPHYVLIAGSPNKVPYELQFSLGVLQAVGRVNFDAAEDYERYAQMVMDQENERGTQPGKRVVFFAPRHPGDYPTSQSSQRLVRPILEQLPPSVPAQLSFKGLIGETATKTNLLEALAPDKSKATPALLFTAGHGAALDMDDPDQSALQGSLICQDYRFPLTPKERTGFITGYDTAEGFSLPGGIHFLFACYGAGTRAHSDFARYLPDGINRQGLLATQGREDFVAYLPKALLANPKGGALAVVGHVDPAWVHSFTSPVTRQRRIDPFGLALARLLRGKPVGFATKAFGQKYADLSTDLLSLIEDLEETGDSPEAANFADLWICRNDAQNYMIIGDPAVRLKFAPS